MSQEDRKTIEKQVVYAPQPNNSSAPGSVLSVEVSNDEEVEWLWTHFPHGQSVITGYKIVKKKKVNSILP